MLQETWEAGEKSEVCGVICTHYVRTVRKNDRACEGESGKSPNTEKEMV